MKIRFHYDPAGALWQGVGLNWQHSSTWHPYFNLGFIAVDWYRAPRELVFYFWRWDITVRFGRR